MTTQDPIQGLIDFVEEIKPFHTKVLEVAIAYAQSDDVDIIFTEDFDMEVSIFWPALADEDDVPIQNCPEGWGEAWDRQSPYIVIDANISPQTVTVDGDQTAFFEVGTRFEIREPTTGSPQGTPAVPGTDFASSVFVVLGSPRYEEITADGEWQDFVNVNTTLDMSGLTLGDDYFVFYTSSFGNPSDGATNNNMIRVAEDTGGSPSGILVPYSQHRIESQSQGGGITHPWAFFTSFTATGNNLKLQAQGTSGAPAISYPHAFAISQTDLSTNALYSEDTTGIVGIGDQWVDSTATITLPNSTDNFLVFWSTQVDVGNSGRDQEVALRFGSGSPQQILTVYDIETEDTAEIYVAGGYVVFPATNNFGSPTGSPLVPIGSPNVAIPITVALRQDVGFSSNNLLRAAIGVINLSEAFEDSFASFNPNLNVNYNTDELLHNVNKVTNTTSNSNWLVLASTSIDPSSGNPGGGIKLAATTNAGSPNTRLVVGSPPQTHVLSISPETRGQSASNEIRPTAAFGILNDVPDGDTINAQLLGISTAGTPLDYNKSLAGFALTQPGTSAILPHTPQVYDMLALSVDYDETTNNTVVGALETGYDFLGSPIVFGSPLVLGSPQFPLPGSPPFTGSEFYFPPYPSGSVSNGDVFIIYDVVATNELRIITRPSPFYVTVGSPVPTGSPYVAGSPLPGSPKIVTGSPATLYGSPWAPIYGSPTLTGNTIIIEAISTAPFIYGREVEIRNASEPSLNKTYNILRAVDLGGSPELIELTLINPVSANTTNDGELVFTPNGWSGGDLCSDIPPELAQTHWMEQLDQTWRFTGSPNLGLQPAFQFFILEADSTNNTVTVQGDVRSTLSLFGSPAGGSPISIPASIQHSIEEYGSPFFRHETQVVIHGSPADPLHTHSVRVGSPFAVNANNGAKTISNVTYNVTTNRSTIFVDSISVNTPTGWIIST